ncbi:MAG: hypothetical protein HUU49_03300 [Candidatus Buchananbacteria bacterium]|nr:hypothetical protein [Candidatus Buchananbacteria bacterium]
MGKKTVTLALITEVAAFNVFVLPLSISYLKEPYTGGFLSRIYIVSLATIVGIGAIYKYFGPWLEEYHKNNFFTKLMKINFNPKEIMGLKNNDCIHYIKIFAALNLFVFPVLNLFKVIIIKIDDLLSALLINNKYYARRGKEN